MVNYGFTEMTFTDDHNRHLAHIREFYTVPWIANEFDAVRADTLDHYDFDTNRFFFNFWQSNHSGGQ